MLVSIIIPCYNSENSIGEVIDQCQHAFDEWEGYECELILVDDYSKDDTWKVITEYAQRYPNVRGYHLSKNFGQHAAVFAGMHKVYGELVVAMDDDLQNHPSQIISFIDKQREGYDVVFGVYKKRRFSLFKNLTGAISRKLLWHLIERPKDIQMSSFWLAKREVIDEVIKYRGNCVFIQLLFFKETANIANIEIEHFDRQYGKSNYTFRKGLKLFLSFMDYSAVPLKVSVYLGTLCSIAGFISALGVIIRKLIDTTIHVGWSSLMSMMLMLAGLIFLMLGIIGQYIGMINDALNQLSPYVISKSTEDK